MLMSSLFEIYDPYTFFMNLSLNWLIILFMIMFFYSKFWFFTTSLFYLNIKFLYSLMVEFSSFYSNSTMKKSSVYLFVCLFFYILVINLLGLIPYVFSSSSQFVYALSLSFPFWMSFMVFGWMQFTNLMFCHLIPVGTPLGLISLMVFIETMSMLIRPWSLSVRLMANMVSGHLLMSLAGDCGLVLFFIQLSLFLFEFFVCFIQAYVFSALLTLYSSEI